MVEKYEVPVLPEYELKMQEYLEKAYVDCGSGEAAFLLYTWGDDSVLKAIHAKKILSPSAPAQFDGV